MPAPVTRPGRLFTRPDRGRSESLTAITDRVNRVATMEVERIAVDCNRLAVPINRDPL